MQSLDSASSRIAWAPRDKQAIQLLASSRRGSAATSASTRSRILSPVGMISAAQTASRSESIRPLEREIHKRSPGDPAAQEDFRNTVEFAAAVLQRQQQNSSIRLIVVMAPPLVRPGGR